ncbi:MAG TPA: amidohydrolase [Acidimicrobiia bacterium]
MDSPKPLSELVELVLPSALELRRALHRHPEPSHEEHVTSQLIADALSSSGISPHLRSPRTGLWVDIGGEPKVGFRADIDALPIDEPVENVPVSINHGWMHACGHDFHSAVAFGIARVLDQLPLPAGVRVLFQPAEEAFPGGAIELVGEGLVDGLNSILAFHVDPTLQTGKVGARIGPITASADRFSISLYGPGGHTARPHQTVDLIPAAARIIVDLPATLRASIDSQRPLIVSFGAIHGGATENVIPTRVELKGTARTVDPEVWAQLPALVDKTLSNLTALSGASYDLEYQQAIPPVINDELVVSTAVAGIERMMGKGTVTDTPTSMGGEDFANYLEVIPGALLRLGAAKGRGDLHSSAFQADESCVAHGISCGVSALLALLDG